MVYCHFGSTRVCTQCWPLLVNSERDGLISLGHLQPNQSQFPRLPSFQPLPSWSGNETPAYNIAHINAQPLHGDGHGENDVKGPSKYALTLLSQQSFPPSPALFPNDRQIPFQKINDLVHYRLAPRIYSFILFSLFFPRAFDMKSIPEFHLGLPVV